MLSVPGQEARCLRPSCQQGWSSQRLWGRIRSLRPAGLASAVAVSPSSCLSPLLASSRCIRPLFPPRSLAALPQWFLLSALPILAVLWGAWRPCSCQDALWGVSHHEGEVTPSLRNAGFGMDSSFSGFGEQRPRASVSLGEISDALPWGQGQGFGVTWLVL